MNIDEYRRLQDWASRYDTIVEIGSWKGVSTAHLCEACKGRVYAVDTFAGSSDPRDCAFKPKEDIFSIFKENTKDYNNLEVLKMTSLEAAKTFPPKSIDMVFIDGDHSYTSVKADLEAWAPIAKKWLCGHDLYFLEQDVKRALEDLGIKYRSVGFNYPLCMWYSEVAQ